MLKKFSVVVVQSDYSVSSLSLLEIKKEREKREIELDKLNPSTKLKILFLIFSQESVMEGKINRMLYKFLM